MHESRHSEAADSTPSTVVIEYFDIHLYIAGKALSSLDLAPLRGIL